MPFLFRNLEGIDREDQHEPARSDNNITLDASRQAAMMWAQIRQRSSSRVAELDESDTDAFASTATESSMRTSPELVYKESELISDNVPIAGPSRTSGPLTSHQDSRNQNQPKPEIHSHTPKTGQPTPVDLKEEPQDEPQYATDTGPAPTTKPAAASASTIPPAHPTLPARPAPMPHTKRNKAQARARYRKKKNQRDRRNQTQQHQNRQAHTGPRPHGSGESFRTHTQQDAMQGPAPRGHCRRHTGFFQPQANPACASPHLVHQSFNFSGAIFSGNSTTPITVKVDFVHHPFTSPSPAAVPEPVCLSFDPKYYDGRQGMPTKSYSMFCASCGCHATDHEAE